MCVSMYIYIYAVCIYIYIYVCVCKYTCFFLFLLGGQVSFLLKVLVLCFLRSGCRTKGQGL